MIVQTLEKKTIAIVNEIVANQGFFFVKLHHYYWYDKDHIFSHYI